MYQTSTHDYIYQQAGLIQQGDINTGIHDYMISKSLLAQSAGNHQLVRSLPIPRGFTSWLLNLVASLIWKTERSYSDLAQAAR
jgi:hypothetical protein